MNKIIIFLLMVYIYLDEVYMRERIDWVDYAKAIGIVLVIYGHVSRGAFVSGVGLTESIFKISDSVIYSFHMPLFFFLSGLFFYTSYTKRGSINFILGKLDNIVYPYLVWSVFQGVVQAALSQYTNKTISYVDVFELWIPKAQFWFLYALFFILFFSCVLLSFDKKQKYNTFFIISFVLYILNPLMSNINPISYIAPNLVYFALGGVFYKYNICRLLFNKTVLLILTTIFLSSQYIYHGLLDKNYADKDIVSFILACISILFIISLSMNLSKRPVGIIMHIGSSSMAIYLMHILAASGMRVILTKFLSIDNTAENLFFGCVAGIFIPLLCIRIIDILHIKFIFSLPISKWIKAIFYKLLKRKVSLNV